ncbi:MAG: alpha/beta fold hydrolase [Shewanellaceae bacterium]|nr:alpha/beta fold hydrolase [Shewanellaceae bacterium]
MFPNLKTWLPVCCILSALTACGPQYSLSEQDLQHAQTFAIQYDSDSRIHQDVLKVWYDDERTIEIAYGVRLANNNPESKPSLWLNFGGPGAANLSLFKKNLNNNVYPTDLLNNYNIVIIEPRGSGGSGLSDFFSQHTTIKSLSGYHDLLRIGTEALVQDMESLREHLNNHPIQGIQLEMERMHLLGYSYGSVVMANYTHHHPDRVHALILDSPAQIMATSKPTGPASMSPADRSISAAPTATSLAPNLMLNFVRCIDYDYNIFKSTQSGQTQKQPITKSNYFCQALAPWYEPKHIFHLKESSVLADRSPNPLLVSSEEDSTTPHQWALDVKNKLISDAYFIKINKRDQHGISFRNITSLDTRCIVPYLNRPSTFEGCGTTNTRLDENNNIAITLLP